MSRKHHGHLKAVVQLVQYIIWASTWEFIYNYSILALNGSRVVLYSLNMINQTSFGHIVIENLPCSQELWDLCVSTLFLQCNAICAFDAYHSQNPYPKVHPGNYFILVFAVLPKIFLFEPLELRAEKLSLRSNKARNFPSFSCKSSMAFLHRSRQPLLRHWITLWIKQ